MMRELVITKHGVQVGKTGQRFTITSRDYDEEESSEDVDLVILTGNASITTSAIRLATERNIPIYVADSHGNPDAAIHPADISNSPKLRLKQLEWRTDEAFLGVAKRIVSAAIENKATLMCDLDRTRDEIDLSVAIADLEELGDQATRYSRDSESISTARELLMNLEGRAAETYFSALQELLPKELYRGTRSRRPPEDPFNAALSYGYGMLYPRVWKSVVYAGLDPYIGVLHAEYGRRPALVMDLTEEFRQPAVDRAVITLIARKQFSASHVAGQGDGVLLNENGRPLIAEAVMEKLNDTRDHNGTSTKLSRHIRNQAISLANTILDEEVYKPFTPSRV